MAEFTIHDVTPLLVHVVEEHERHAGDPRVKLRSGWCECEDGECTFHSYPADGECSCGVHKHHVHGTCGGITQIG